MKEIHISKRSISGALILGVVIALGILAIQALPIHNGSQPTMTTQEDTLASKAAASALEAFFRVDYREEKATWLNRICAVSTPSGCQLFSSGADQLWSKFQSAKTNVTAKVTPEEMVTETATEQILKMSVSLSGPLPGSNEIQDTAYVAVINTENGWKFDRFLLEPEIKALLTHQLATVSPAQAGK